MMHLSHNNIYAPTYRVKICVLFFCCLMFLCTPCTYPYYISELKVTFEDGMKMVEVKLVVHMLYLHLQKDARPVQNSSLPLNVHFDMSIHHIIDVDEKNQILTMNCWITQKWNDYQLTWNKSHFGGVQSIRLPYDIVWKPDIILYNK